MRLENRDAFRSMLPLAGVVSSTLAEVVAGYGQSEEAERLLSQMLSDGAKVVALRVGHLWWAGARRAI